MIRKLGLALSAAALMCAAGVTAKADTLPGLTNLNFTDYTGSAPKGRFTDVKPVGWQGGGNLVFIDSQNFAGSAAGPVYLQTYGNPSGNITGNYVEADGNPQYEDSFSYKLTGLTVGKTYTLSFYQGASQQVGYNGATTNQWIVSLGTTGLSTKSIGGGFDTYYNTDAGASVVASPLMNIPNHGTVGWNYVSVNLTADSTTDLLSFLAWGDNGNTANLPPIAFLAGVDSPPGLGVPEPSTWALMILGLGAMGAVARRRRAPALA